MPWKFDASSPLTLTLTLEKTKKTTKFQKKILSLMNFPRIPCVTLVLRRRQKFSSDEETDKEEGEEDFGRRRRREREGLRWRW
jgi:hypothetical protein